MDLFFSFSTRLSSTLTFDEKVSIVTKEPLLHDGDKMRLPDQVSKFIEWKYSHIVACFIAGAGLELFMNFFHIGEANIYRSIKKNLSTSEAEKRFEAERMLFEKLEGNDSEE